MLLTNSWFVGIVQRCSNQTLNTELNVLKDVYVYLGVDCGLDDRGSIAGKDRDFFLFATASKPAL
jgi:hypothetical protein